MFNPNKISGMKAKPSKCIDRETMPVAMTRAK
jgi:hypothetical protein